jgi:hypothetical protein
MTRLSERLKEIGITDPGAEGDPDAQLRQLEELRGHVEESIRVTKQRQDRERAKWAEEDREQRERWEAKHREGQDRRRRVVAFYGDLGVRIGVGRAVDCWSAQCRDRRRGVTVPPGLHVDADGGRYWCERCPTRGGLLEAAEAHGQDPVWLLKKHGFGDEAELVERRRKALSTINRKLASIGRSGWGDLRTARDAAVREGSLEELERVAGEASKLRKGRSESDG